MSQATTPPVTRPPLLTISQTDILSPSLLSSGPTGEPGPELSGTTLQGWHLAQNGRRQALQGSLAPNSAAQHCRAGVWPKTANAKPRREAWQQCQSATHAFESPCMSCSAGTVDDTSFAEDATRIDESHWRATADPHDPPQHQVTSTE
uniref:Uncharacterized protein n=1 Tax=Sphaerodactylus townsendi TaxID=933632 RepID=A0ACB8EFE2_9SAUR